MRIELDLQDRKELRQRLYGDEDGMYGINRSIDDIVDLIMQNRALDCDIDTMRSLIRKFSEEANAWLDQVCEMSGTPSDERYLEMIEIAKSHKEDIVHHLGDRIDICVNGQVYLGTLLAPNAVIVRRYEPGSTRLMSSRHDEPDERDPLQRAEEQDDGFSRWILHHQGSSPRP